MYSRLTGPDNQGKTVATGWGMGLQLGDSGKFWGPIH